MISHKEKLRFAIIGCGLIGRKRAATLAPGELAAVCDQDLSRAQELARLYPGVQAHSEFRPILDDKSVSAMIVSTPNSTLAPIAIAAIQAGKHVLVEKPGGLNAAELETMAKTASQAGVGVRIGFNHRLHPAFLKARQIFETGELGPLMFIRGRYGHGGRVGYDREWRANPKLSGGGELIDQGVHLIDLARWFLGDFTFVEGHAATYYWNMPVDDNAFLNLRNEAGQTAWLQVSCTEWKNLFSFEIYGKKAKLHVEGLGGSYGVERLYYYKMPPEMGPPETQIWEFPAGDRSWALEMEEFREDVRSGRTPVPGITEALAALRIVGTIYGKSGYHS